MRARATDPYKLLSVPWDADELTVRKRYRQLAKQHHPNAGGDSEDFRLLKEAFEQILFDVRNNIEEDVTIARVRPEENRKQELNEEPNFRKNPRAAPVHERSSKAEQPTAQVSGTSRYMNVQLKLRNRSCSDPHAPVRKKRGHRITLANWRHAFYERHPFVTLGGLLTGLLLTGLLLKAPLVSSSSSPELRKPPHKLRNTAAPIATWSSSSESLARSVPPALPEPNVAARLPPSELPWRLPAFVSTPPPALLLSSPKPLSYVPPASEVVSPTAAMDAGQRGFPSSTPQLPPPKPFRQIRFGSVGETAVIRNDIEYRLIMPSTGATTLGVIGGTKVQFKINGIYQQCTSTIVFDDRGGIQAPFYVRSCGYEAKLIVRSIAAPKRLDRLGREARSTQQTHHLRAR
jgi:hypothetical protein